MDEYIFHIYKFLTCCKKHYIIILSMLIGGKKGDFWTCIAKSARLLSKRMESHSNRVCANTVNTAESCMKKELKRATLKKPGINVIGTLVNSRVSIMGDTIRCFLHLLKQNRSGECSYPGFFL